MKKLIAAVVSNGIEGLKNYFISSEVIHYSFLEISNDFDPDLESYQLLIVPNGSDSIAMSKIKDKVANFLNDGKALFCFDGWFTNWVPNNQWIMSNDLKSIDQRYTVNSDRNNLLENVDIQDLIYSHKMSGWWSCGYINASEQAEVILQDTWKRPIVVLDEKSTKGTIFLTASAPLGDTGITNTNYNLNNSLAQLYQNIVFLIIKKLES